MRFQRKPTHNYLGDVWRDPNNRHDKREEEHNLYFDNQAGVYIVVEEVEHVSGPHVSCSHIVYPLADYVRQFPTRQRAIQELIRSHQGASDGAGPLSRDEST